MKRVLTFGLAVALILCVLLPAGAAWAKVPTGYTSKVDYENTDPNKYKIEIDLVNQIITVYETATGSLILQGLCTTGNEENATGTGTFKLGHLKERFGYFVAFGQYAQYWTQVVRGIYIHSVMYDSRNITTMSKAAYNNLGKPLSHGCVRVLPEYAQWIFYNCPPGTTCVITKGRAQNPELIKQLKAAMPSYKNYKQPTDYKADPPIVPATIKLSNVPVRTGFSNVRDTTVQELAQGDVVQVLQLGPDWCKVETKKGKFGYVQTKYLAMNPDQTVSRHGSYYAKSETYLYSKADMASSRLYTYTQGDEIDVINAVDKYWLTAKVGDAYGYVRVKFTQSTKPDVTAPVVTDNGEPNAYIKSGIIANMRSGPGTEYEVIAELQAGTPVRLMEIVGSWYVIMVDGMEGYVSKVCVAYY